jgi:TQXA domain-containing protein
MAFLRMPEQLKERLILLVRTSPHANGPHPKGNSVFAASSPLKRGAVRLAVSATASGMLTAGMVAGAAVARAEGEPQGRGGAAATLSGLKLSGEAVVRRGDEERRVQAGLFEMAVDGGGTLRTYGVDLDMATQWDAEYREASWSSTSLGANSATGKIRWILQNSYPQVNDLADLARRAGAEGLTEQDAAAGTQVAIWRYSDGPGARVRPRDGGTRQPSRGSPRPIRRPSGSRTTWSARRGACPNPSRRWPSTGRPGPRC